MKQFDVIVIGGGHAGTEAADAARRMGARTALITFRRQDLGVMSCNPAFGGIGKGHLVREIDALDGLMGRAADYAGIQFRLLNRRKGPAVQGPRVQADRDLYHHYIQRHFQRAVGITVIEAEVVELVTQSAVVSGVTLSDGTSLRAQSVVLTTGTFLGGVIHIGNEAIVGGRLGSASSIKLSDQIRELATEVARLKTGTPPRIDKRSVDFAELATQPGDDRPEMMSFLSMSPVAPQVACAITATGPKTHDIIRENLGQSAIYGGKIESSGPRYCPSVEDKVVRFPERDSHQIFLEPEGLRRETIYPNGISMSLPVAVQESVVQSVRGLAAARLIQPGYAIEYDYVDPRSLTATLALKELPSVFLAGQINGTTGYEEAGAQGLVAGVNAAAVALGKQPMTIGRADGYIGVLVSDLIERGVSEPYRMFTSRAEYRLSLRADNADQRLTPLGVAAGCVQPVRWTSFQEKLAKLESARDLLDRTTIGAGLLQAEGLGLSDDGNKRSALELLGIPGCDIRLLQKIRPELGCISDEIADLIGKEAVYRPQLARQQAEIRRLKADEAVKVPADFDFSGLPGLSSELRQKLTTQRPHTIAEASRINGMTPAALLLLLSKVKSRASAQREQRQAHAS